MRNVTECGVSECVFFSLARPGSFHIFDGGQRFYFRELSDLSTEPDLYISQAAAERFFHEKNAVIRCNFCDEQV